jgi:hypothetical protein
MRPVAGSKRNTLASGIEPPLARLTSPPAMTTLPPERRCATCAIRCESAADCTSVKVSFTGTYAEKIEGIPYPRTNIERCIEACKANTHRTPEKCLDACNHR